MNFPKGIRLNNPGNIVRNEISWQGMSTMQDDPRFVRFETPVFGIRALMKILQNYYFKYQLDSVRAIINRFAPPVENDTESYIIGVAKQLKVTDNDVIDLEDKSTLITLVQAIIIHENGNPPDNMPKFWYGDSVYIAAYKSL